MPDLSNISFIERVTALDKPQWLQTADAITTLQINIGTCCNLSCKHCHVQAGPDRSEAMDQATLEACLEVFATGGFKVLDITGGAPELHPMYRELIIRSASLAQKVGGEVITRTNLVILTEGGFDDLPRLWADNGIEVVASLPSWEERNTNRQRGEGVFKKALEGLQMLNAIGYGQRAANATGQPLVLNIVVNPGGAFLPPAQASAEREFKDKLKERYGVTFDNLLTITNNPVGRFKKLLESRGKYTEYLKRLSDSFNPATVENMMCRSQISVSWDGRLFDCDFNQVADLPLEKQPTIFSVVEEGLRSREIRFDDHCYACCAGAGSSCGGATAG